MRTGQREGGTASAAGGRKMMLELVLFDGSDRRFEIRRDDELTVGTAAHCNVRLQSPDVSRRHALVLFRRGRLVVLDLGSKNGTFVNGRRIDTEEEIAAGDTLRFSSVSAQVLPPPGSSGSKGYPAVDGLDPSSDSSGQHAEMATSDGVPAILNESLLWLLARWEEPAVAATRSLVEWLVTYRAARGAAVIEAADGDLSVIAVHGDLASMLTEPVDFEPLGAAGPAVPRPESLQLMVRGRRVVAVRSAERPWLVLVPGSGMPDSQEIDLYARLLGVATRLDGSGTEL